MQRRIPWLAQLCGSIALLALSSQGTMYGRSAASASGAVVRTVRLSPDVGQVVLDPATEHLFIPNGVQHTIEMRDAATGNLLRAIPAGSGSGGGGLLLAGRQRRLFVISGDLTGRGGSAMVVDTRTGAVLRNVAVGPSPWPLLVDEGADRALVGTEAIRIDQGRETISGALVFLDAATGQITARIAFPGPVNLGAFDASRHRAIVLFQHGSAAQPQEMSYGVIDTRAGRLLSIADSNQNGQAPVLDPRRGIAMIIDMDEGTVHVINLDTGVVLHVIPVDAFLWSGAIDPLSGRAYVVSQGRASTNGAATGGTFSALDLAAGIVLHQTAIGQNATGISLNAAGDRAFVAIHTGGLKVVDTATGQILRTVPVGVASDYLPAFVSHGLAYVMSFGEVTPQGVIDVQAGGMLRVLDAHDGRLLRTIAVGQNPPSGGFPLPYSKGAVSVIDAATGTLVRKIPVGIGPSLIALGQSLIGLDPATGRLLVLNAEGDGSAPPAPGDTAPVCSPTTLPAGPDTPPCRPPYASLSIISVTP